MTRGKDGDNVPKRTNAEAFEQAAVIVGNPRHLVAALMQELGVGWIEADDIFDAEVRASGFSTPPQALSSLADMLRRCAARCRESARV
jgi:hypothetical protein